MGAPVCELSQDQVIEQPTPRVIPPVPVARDLQSLIAAVNALRQIVFMLLGAPVIGGTGQTRPSNQKAPNQKVSRFAEVPGSRVTKDVRIDVESDTGLTGYIIFQQINRVQMKDNVTNETWLWQR
jgi:hypothetical protein